MDLVVYIELAGVTGGLGELLTSSWSFLTSSLGRVMLLYSLAWLGDMVIDLQKGLPTRRQQKLDEDSYSSRCLDILQLFNA